MPTKQTNLAPQAQNIDLSSAAQFDLSCCKAFVDAVDAQVVVFRDEYAANLEQQDRLTMMTYVLDELMEKLACLSEKIEAMNKLRNPVNTPMN